MEGLDASSVADDEKAAIKYAIAAVMDGVKSDQIKKVEVTDSSRRRKLLSSSAVVSFDVIVSLSSSSFTDSTDLLDEVQETLTEVADDSTALMLAIEENSSSDIWDDVTGISDATSTMTTLR